MPGAAGYSREDLAHGIGDPIHGGLLLWQLVILPHTNAVVKELIAQEGVGHVELEADGSGLHAVRGTAETIIHYLTEYDDQVQQLAEEEDVSVPVVLVLKVMLEGHQERVQLLIVIFNDAICASFG